LFQQAQQEIAERKLAQDALRESEKRYRQLVEHAPAGIYEIDLSQGKFISVNDVMCEYTGYTKEEFLSIRPLDILTEESQALFFERQAKTLAHEPIPDTVEYKIRGKNQREFWVILNSRLEYDGDIPRRATIVVHDITQRKQAEEMMLQSSRMASVGRLAAGVAHEINNPLGGMMQSAQLLHMAFDVQRPRTRERLRAAGLDPAALERYLQAHNLSEYLDGIRSAGERAAKIITELLSFSRRASSAFAPHDLNNLIEQTLDLAAADYDLYNFREIEIARDFAPDLPQIHCDGQQIQQVVLNLVRNAAQAMAGGIEKGDREYSPRLTLRTLLAPDASFVRLEVEDNGPGIPEDIRTRLFEPFFTTRDVGEGAGLGLWVCWSIVVEQHKGRIWVEPVAPAPAAGDALQESAGASGSRFVVELPIK
jgi:PAS domain S-box-containing protein